MQDRAHTVKPRNTYSKKNSSEKIYVMDWILTELNNLPKVISV